MCKILVSTTFNSDSLDVKVLEFKSISEADIAYQRLACINYDVGLRQVVVKLY